LKYTASTTAVNSESSSPGVFLDVKESAVSAFGEHAPPRPPPGLLLRDLHVSRPDAQLTIEQDWKQLVDDELAHPEPGPKVKLRSIDLSPQNLHEQSDFFNIDLGGLLVTMENAKVRSASS
jgi:hypothetical protein